MVWGSGAPGLLGLPGLQGSRGSGAPGAPRWWVGDYSKSEMACFAECIKFIFQIFVLISKCQLWCDHYEKTFCSWLWRIIDVQQGEERGAFEFYAGVDVAEVNSWVNKNLGTLIENKRGLEYHSAPGNVSRTRVRSGQLWEWVMWCGFGRWKEMLIFQILLNIGKLFSIPSIEQGFFCSVR